MATFAMTRSGVNTTGTTWPNIKSERLTSPVASDERQTEIQYNNLLNRIAAMLSIMGGDGPLTTATPTIGTTVTMAIPAQTVFIKGVPAALAAETAKAFGSLGTIPTTKWGLIVVERIADGTTSFVSAAANYTTGYATEALALAAAPSKSANKAVVGYITVYASHASGWIAGTDALAGGSGGNPAGATNYYGVLGIADTGFWTNYQIGNLAGTALTSTHY